MRVKTDAKRWAILDAASAVFREEGFAGASMAAVAKRIGASKATLYRYFPSKEDLFVSVMLEAVLEEAGPVFDTLKSGANLADTLKTFGCGYLKFTLSSRALAVRRMVIAEGVRSGLGDRLYNRGAKAVWSRVADFLEAQMAAARLARADPWTAAMHLRGLLEADVISRALIGARFDGATPRLRRHSSEAVDIFLRAYESKSS